MVKKMVPSAQAMVVMEMMTRVMLMDRLKPTTRRKKRIMETLQQAVELAQNLGISQEPW